MTAAALIPTNKKNKIDFKKAFKMRFLNGNEYSVIAKQFDCTADAVHKLLKPVNNLLKSCELYSTYHNNAAQVQEIGEAVLLQEMLDPDKIKKASVNNLAYAYDKLRQARTGQSIGNTAITIELVFQQAETEAKKLRRSSADIVINQEPG